MEQDKNSFMNYRVEAGKQIGTNDPIEQGLLSLMNYNIPIQETKDGLQLLLKIVQNIQKNPTEPKFHTLKKDNPKLKQSLFSLRFMSEFLIELGFTDLQDNYSITYLTDDIYDNIRKASRSLESYINSFQVLQQGDPKLNNIVEQKKKEFEEKQAYKQQILQQFETNKHTVIHEHQTGDRKKQYQQREIDSQSRGYKLKKNNSNNNSNRNSFEQQ